MPAKKHAKVIIIGSGPAGYTAAIYAARAMLQAARDLRASSPAASSRSPPTSRTIRASPTSIQGPWLMEQMKAQAEHVGTEMVADHIVEVDLVAAALRGSRATAATIYTCDALIIATGAQARWLGLPSRRRSSRATASRPARPATASSSAASTSSSSAAATPRSRRRSYPHQLRQRRSPSCTAATASAPRRSCRTGCSRNPKIEVVWNTTVEEISATSDRGGHRRRLQERQDRRDAASCRSTASSSPSAMSPATELFKGQLDDRSERLHHDGAELDRDQRPRRLRRGRRDRRDLPPGGDGRRHGLHGGARGRALPGSRRKADAARAAE